MGFSQLAASEPVVPQNLPQVSVGVRWARRDAVPDSPTGDFPQNTHSTAATSRGWVSCTVTADTSRHAGASKHRQPCLRLPAGVRRSLSEDSVCSSAGFVFIQAEFHSHTPDTVRCVLYCYTGEEPPVLGVNFTLFGFPS